MRCSEARVFRTPSHVKASFTAAIVVRSLWAAERSSWVVGVLVGRVVERREMFWPVSVDVVVAVDMEWFLFWFLGGAEDGADDSLSPRIRPSLRRIRP